MFFPMGMPPLPVLVAVGAILTRSWRDMRAIRKSLLTQKDVDDLSEKMLLDALETLVRLRLAQQRRRNLELSAGNTKPFQLEYCSST